MESTETDLYRQLEVLNTDTLFSMAAKHRKDSRIYLFSIRIIASRGDQKSYDRAVALCYETSYKLRTLGMHLVRKFGASSEKNYIVDALTTLLSLLFTEKDSRCIEEISCELPKNQDVNDIYRQIEQSINNCLQQYKCRSSYRREAIAEILYWFHNVDAVHNKIIDTLIEMVNDPCKDVGYQALSSLGKCLKYDPVYNDDPEQAKIIEILLQHLNEPGSIVRGKALDSLQSCGYKDITALISKELLSNDFHPGLLITVRSMEDPSLCPILKQLQSKLRTEPEYDEDGLMEIFLNYAIQACCGDLDT